MSAQSEAGEAAPSGVEGWIQSCDAGYRDSSEAWAGSSEIIHLVPNRRQLHAANGNWKDIQWEGAGDEDRQSAQVLGIDSPAAKWGVGLDTSAWDNAGGRHMKGNILQSVTFATDHSDQRLSPHPNLLVMASGSIRSNVSAWVRDDKAGTWSHEIVKSGSAADGGRWMPRDMESDRDQLTGIRRMLPALGNPGIIPGVHDAALPAKIR